MNQLFNDNFNQSNKFYCIILMNQLFNDIFNQSNKFYCIIKPRLTN